jgi:hypothetical protein
MATTRTVSLALACAALLAGCGSSAGSDQDARSFCQQQAAALVPSMTACMSTDPAFASAYLSLALECEALGEMQAAGTLGIDASKVDACLAAVKGLSCLDLYLLDGGVPEACRAVLVPEVEPGGACHSTSGVECVAGWCDVTACNLPGTCVAYAQLGQPCDVDRCAPGLVCAGGTCEELVVHRAGVGESCNVLGVVCDEGLYCHYDTGTSASTCQPVAAVGSDCSDDSRACPVGSLCRSTGTAHLCVPVAAAGERCAPGLRMCQQGLSCAPDDDAGLTGVCTAWPGVGGACGFTPQEVVPCAQGYCDEPLISRLAPARLAPSSLAVPTTTGTCQPFKALGDACSGAIGGECDLRATCVDGTCQRSYCVRRLKPVRRVVGD